MASPKPLGPALPFTPEATRGDPEGMFDVVNGSGTGGGSRIDIGGVKMAGKTGTAQVRRMLSRGHVADWKGRDHSLFICYAPTDAPRYAMAVVIEHGGFGASAAAPIAKDVMTYLFDPQTALDALHAKEEQWGGTATQPNGREVRRLHRRAGCRRRTEQIEVLHSARVDAESRAVAPKPQPTETGALMPVGAQCRRAGGAEDVMSAIIPTPIARQPWRDARSADRCSSASARRCSTRRRAGASSPSRCRTSCALRSSS